MYMCDKCGRSFNNLDNFKTHQVIHAGMCAMSPHGDLCLNLIFVTFCLFLS